MGKDQLICALEVFLVLSADAVDSLHQTLLLLTIIAALLELDELFTLLHSLQFLHTPQLLLCGVHHQQRIFYEVLLDNVIQGSVSRETRSVIDLQKKNPILVVNHKVKPQQLKAHIRSSLLRTA